MSKKTIMKYKQQGTSGLFSEDFRLEKLSRQGDPLEKLNKVVDWEYFRPPLEKGMINQDKMVNAGAKPYDPLLMFKILILQRSYHLGDEPI
ncbi:MAG: transposase, partial [Cytophagales bacterium]|nr:transposase [Cytophagales bacterium]